MLQVHRSTVEAVIFRQSQEHSAQQRCDRPCQNGYDVNNVNVVLFVAGDCVKDVAGLSYAVAAVEDAPEKVQSKDQYAAESTFLHHNPHKSWHNHSHVRYAKDGPIAKSVGQPPPAIQRDNRT